MNTARWLTLHPEYLSDVSWKCHDFFLCEYLVRAYLRWQESQRIVSLCVWALISLNEEVQFDYNPVLYVVCFVFWTVPVILAEGEALVLISTGLVRASALDGCCYRQVPPSVVQRLIEHRAHVSNEQGAGKMFCKRFFSRTIWICCEIHIRRSCCFETFDLEPHATGPLAYGWIIDKLHQPARRHSFDLLPCQVFAFLPCVCWSSTRMATRF